MGAMGMHVTQDYTQRYDRQRLLPMIGEAGQAKLRHATAMIVGCGALGTVLADQLARAGVGHLVIADRDYVEWSNLQRQVLFDESDARHALPKAVAAQKKLNAINAGVRVTAIVDDVRHTNIEAYAGLRGDGATPRVDVLLDGTDNFETRYLVNDVAVKHGIPYVYAGAVGTTAAGFVVLPHTLAGEAPWEAPGVERATPDLRDLFEDAPAPGTTPTCDTAGVLGPAVAMIAGWQASEAVKVLTGAWDAVCPTMLNLDVWQNTTRHFDVQGAYDQSAGICSKQRRFEYLDGKKGGAASTLCGRHAVQLRPGRGDGATGADGPPDLQALAGRWQTLGAVQRNAYMLRVRLAERGASGEPMTLTVFRDGRAIVQGTTQTAEARSVYAKYVGG